MPIFGTYTHASFFQFYIERDFFLLSFDFDLWKIHVVRDVRTMMQRLRHLNQKESHDDRKLRQKKKLQIDL